MLYAHGTIIPVPLTPNITMISNWIQLMKPENNDNNNYFCSNSNNHNSMLTLIINCSWLVPQDVLEIPKTQSVSLNKMSQKTQVTQLELMQKENTINAFRQILDQRDTTIAEQEQRIERLQYDKYHLTLKLRKLELKNKRQHFLMIGILPILFIATFLVLLIITLWLELAKGVCIGNAIWKDFLVWSLFRIIDYFI